MLSVATGNKEGLKQIPSLQASLESFGALPVVGDAGNVAAVGAEAHRANPAVVRAAGENG